MTTIRSGTYHNSMFHNDHELLFKCIENIFTQGMREESGDNNFYMLNEVKRSDDYLLGRMAFVQAKGTFRTVPKDRNIIVKDEKDNIVQTTVMFYMNSNNDIILEDKSRLPREKFVEALRELISKYTEQYSPYNAPIMGHRFEVSFDRYDNRGVGEYLDSISSLQYVEMKILVWSNPHRNANYENLKNKILETDAKKYKIEGNNINKDADIIRSTEGMVEDGHIDLRMKGRDENGDPAEYHSNRNMDDQYEVDRYKDDLEIFKGTISGIIATVRRKHSNR